MILTDKRASRRIQNSSRETLRTSISKVQCNYGMHEFSTPEDVYKTAQPGDMLEFNRGAYSHWGIYLGLGRVVHPQIPPQTAGKDCLSTCCSAMSGQAVNKALVQEDDLKTASNGGLVRVNNMYDGKQTPLDQAKILETAKQRLGDKKYNLLTNNCEHFANECRYGIPQSSQLTLGENDTVADSKCDCVNGQDKATARPVDATDVTFLCEKLRDIGRFSEIQTHNGKASYRLKQDHHYYDQVQGQLHILNKSACDFVVWTTKDIAIVRILQDAMWTPNMEKLDDFYFSKLLPIIQQ
ncbi:hypothetical protein FSP39_020013 [Pinctada imbricata]|uniref:LRAT domain-containing protein n=1 Tax=Pinctada imbricata TaxID=66713 RepID=A0AA88XGT0_PINIB|nr:hypothetical protein FSP39_020013 [Pinctada imbricata]